MQMLLNEDAVAAATAVRRFSAKERERERDRVIAGCIASACDSL